MLDLHIKFIRLIKGVLTLRDYSFNPNDPMEKVVILGKINAYMKLTSDFFQNDFQGYLNNFK